MKIDVDHIARLANLSLSQDQKKKFAGEIDEVLGYVAKVEKAAGKPSHLKPSGKKTRVDSTDFNLTLSQQDSLSGAQKEKNGFFVTKGVFDEN